MCISVQVELDTLFGQLKGMKVRSREISALAHSKAARGAFGRAVPAWRSRGIDMARWNGLRVLAAGATRLRVSGHANAKLSADHYAFALFLSGAELTLHAQPESGRRFRAPDAV